MTGPYCKHEGDTYKILVRKCEGKVHLENLVVDGKMILKRILRRNGLREWAGPLGSGNSQSLHPLSEFIRLPAELKENARKFGAAEMLFDGVVT
jgi:hypothetical protein